MSSGNEKMMGVKPNRKSSVPLVMLLLFFATKALALDHCPSDTLILDGEIIEIEVNDKSSERDSLEEWGKQDTRKFTQRKYNNRFAFQMGAVYNVNSVTSDVRELTFLPTYMGFKKHNALGFDVHTSYRRDIGELRIMGAPVVWGVEVGFGLQQLKWKSIGFDPVQIDKDSLVGFRRDGDQLFLDYITIFDEPFPVYELDTLELELIEQKFVVNSAIVRIGPTLSWELPGQSDFTLSLGVNYRLQFQRVKVFDQYWIGEQGQYSTQKAEELAMKTYVLSPFMRASWSKDLVNRMRWGLSLMAIGPANVINDNQDLQWSNWQLLGQLCWSKSF
jgi:hypothetical protein